MQSNVLNTPRDEGRIASPEDVRLWGMQSFAAGATGLLYLRWRPLLDGPLFGAFGPYGMDGSRTERSEMAARLAKWTGAPEQVDLWQARPVQGDLGILVVPESQLFCYAQQGNTDLYAHSAKGAYRGFFENNIQADFVHINDIDQYRVLYLPFPIHLAQEQAARLREWVHAGGTLISEGCPGYWGERGHVGTTQPNLGLDELFGARQEYVEFTPDILTGLIVEWQGIEIPGGVFLQAYEPTTGEAVGRYTGDVAGPSAGHIAAVEHRFGEGRTLLLGTFPGYGHSHGSNESSRDFFRALAEWAGVEQHVKVAGRPQEKDGRWWGLTARIHATEDGSSAYLWVTNPAPEMVTAELELAERWPPPDQPRLHWGEHEPKVDGRHVTVAIPARDAAVLRLR